MKFKFSSGMYVKATALTDSHILKGFKVGITYKCNEIVRHQDATVAPGIWISSKLTSIRLQSSDGIVTGNGTFFEKTEKPKKEKISLGLEELYTLRHDGN